MNWLYYVSFILTTVKKVGIFRPWELIFILKLLQILLWYDDDNITIKKVWCHSPYSCTISSIVFGPNSTIEFGPILAYLITQLLPPSSSYSVRDSGSKYGLWLFSSWSSVLKRTLLICLWLPSCPHDWWRWPSCCRMIQHHGWSGTLRSWFSTYPGLPKMITYKSFM